jgi:D-sedoheptulose 7-phosphate isomerase
MTKNPYSIRPDAVTNRYLRQLDALLTALDVEAINGVVERLKQARDDQRTIFLAGNGGSAATAAHLANDLNKATRNSGRTYIRCLCLADNVPWFSALANDEGYERVFAGQLENFAEPGDVLIVISASGNSPNLLAAVECARQRNVTTVGLLGFDGGRLRTMVDHLLWTESPTGLYGPVESVHTIVGDILTTCLIEDRVDGQVRKP